MPVIGKKGTSLQKELLKSKLPPMYRPMDSGPSSGGGARNRCRRDYTPTSWSSYFDSYEDVKVSDGDVFRVYLKGETGPLLYLLHGGGYSGLSWSLFCESISEKVECRIAAPDIRGHGETKCVEDGDLSAETLSKDVGKVISALYGDGDDVPPVILVGHSMGGAIAVHAVYNELVPTAIGLVVIDVVEGTAMEALQSMQSFLRSRPTSFPSLSTAIEWCVRSGQVRNVKSAKVSMPGQLKNATSNLCATREVHLQVEGDQPEAPAPRQIISGDSILEEEEEGAAQQQEQAEAARNQGPFKRPHPASDARYTWRIELSKTEKFWPGWFEGLSNMFLSTAVPKLLLLAGVDRLDRDLTIGQMQGKFQMQVLPQCGHAVHEDDPDKVADAIASFLVRNKFASALKDFQRPFAGC